MGVKNPWAFVSETGHERVTAYGIWQRRLKYDGRAIGEIFFSPHKPGRRKPMRHVRRDGTPHFAYMSASDEHAAGPGESLSHRLFKETIASLSGTRLVLNGGRGEEVITITSGEIEKEVVHADGSYFADAYVRFESKGDLGLKWSGEVYVEIHKTHEVPREKIDVLRALRLPVVEIKVPEFAEYQHPDEKTTDELEEWHRQRLKRILEGSTGFLMAKVLSDPSSAEYLEKQLGEAHRKLEELRKEAAETSSNLDVARNHERKLASRLGELEAVNDGLRKQVNSLATTLRDIKASETGLADQLRKKNAMLDDTHQQLKMLQIVGATLVAIITCLALFKLVALAKDWFA